MKDSERSERKKSDEAKRSKDKESESRYRPVVENLILFVLNKSRWFRTVRRVVEDEARERGGLALRGLVFLVAGLSLFALTLTLLILLLILVINIFFDDLVISVAIVLIVTLIMSALLLYLTAQSFGKAFDMSELEQKKKRLRKTRKSTASGSTEHR